MQACPVGEAPMRCRRCWWEPGPVHPVCAVPVHCSRCWGKLLNQWVWRRYAAPAAGGNLNLNNQWARRRCAAAAAGGNLLIQWAQRRYAAAAAGGNLNQNIQWAQRRCAAAAAGEISSTSGHGVESLQPLLGGTSSTRSRGADGALLRFLGFMQGSMPASVAWRGRSKAQGASVWKSPAA